MIKCTDYVLEGFTLSGKTEVRASLVADNKAEVLANGVDASNISGISDDSVLTLGSTCMTADGDYGILDSSSAWHF